MKNEVSINLISGDRSGTSARDRDVPATVDVSLTGRCQLRCAWCWGPKHNLKERRQSGDWQKLFARLSDIGTNHIVFTGGDPLISPMLPNLMREAKHHDFRTTLSTNALLLREKSFLLKYVDDLGIPIDGASAIVNDTMRKRSGRYKAWEAAVDGLLLAQELGIATTARTVISRKNLEDVPHIPGALASQGVDLDRLRHKMYQIEPIGPHVEVSTFEEWAISENEARSAAAEIRSRYPNLDVTLQLYKNTRGRYFQVDPDGNAYGTDLDSAGHPTMVPYGNMFDDFEGALYLYRLHLTSLAAV